MASLSLSAPAFAEDTGSAATAGQSAPATEGASSEKPLDAAQCIAFHTEGQRSSKSGDLKAALEAFTSCALEQCPDVVSAECINLRASVEKRLPTVLFSVTSAEGEDLTNYEIWMDDELLLDELDGHAVAVNPGQRTVAFVDEQGNRHEQVVVFHEGELARRVDYRLEPAVVPAPKVAPEQKRPPRRIHPLTWVGGGLALAGGGAFAGLALVGKDREKALDEECAPVCTDAEVAPVKTMYLAADVALGVGVAGATAAIIGLFLPATKKTDPRADTAVSIVPGIGGRSMLFYSGRF